MKHCYIFLPSSCYYHSVIVSWFYALIPETVVCPMDKKAHFFIISY